MSEIAQEHPDQNIVDALELAMRNVAFEPIPTTRIEESNSPGMPITSGSVRLKHAYDVEAQSVVFVVEAYSLIEFDQAEGPVDDHRLVVWWEDGTPGEEFDLDARELIFDEDEECTEEKITASKHRLMQALRAVMTD